MNDEQGNTNSQQPVQQEAPVQQGTQLNDVAALQREVDKLRAEAAKHRVQRNEYRDVLGNVAQQIGLEPVKQADQLATFQQQIQQAVQQQIQQAVQQAVQPIQQQLEQEAQQRAQAEQAALEAQVRGEFGLPGYVRSLEGQTPEELRQDAEKLAAEIAAQRPSQPVIGATNPGGQTGQSSDVARQLYQQRRGGLDFAMELFSPESNEQMGGGVFFNSD